MSSKSVKKFFNYAYFDTNFANIFIIFIRYIRRQLNKQDENFNKNTIKINL
jgi:hypothetical protein